MRPASELYDATRVKLVKLWTRDAAGRVRRHSASTRIARRRIAELSMGAPWQWGLMKLSDL